ncbi:FHF complex subunit HOOK interacting protein 1B isoform X2 [Hypomesus transpacificus]|uniref:FHF complex subunit HOOK interacting protein 1B isoform X2 n=1 Tax=Hypomesus transpacificus TaxID=137520 RepID=UPI001F07EBDC|nr:FHF complex subunit HOOK interacting protein 1B isoform X2 [Hypomesus transpacificus]
MSWLSRMTPRVTGSRSRTTPPSGPCTADPETCLMVFENHWRQLSWVLEQRDPSSSSDDLTTVRNHTDQMLCLLAEERPGETEGVAPAGAHHASPALSPAPGPILRLVSRESILERLVAWHLRRGLDPDSQGALLKLFEMLIGQSQQPLLTHAAVLQPLLGLLGACSEPQQGGCPPALENSLVLLLNQMCVTMARQPAVLELLFRASAAQQGPTNLLIFSLLVPFIHRDGAIGQQARDALLLVMATSASNQSVARYIAENSYFCPVLATGLSALYSSLPRKMEVRGDDWHALRREDWMGVSSLVLFMNSLEFCNAVIQVAHPLVRSQLVDYVHNGFLVPVMGPALHKSSVDEMIASTAYLDLFLRSVTETALLKTFLRFILMHRHDNDTILDTLLTRIGSNSRLCMVSLSLFKTLLSLNCEDFMLQLVLRYLLPCTHVMLSQRRAVRETDLYGKSADKFLSLIPECCRLGTLPPADREEEPAFWGKVLGSPASEPPPQPRPSTPSRLALFMRQQSSGGAPSSPSPEPVPSSPRGGPPGTPLSPDSPLHQGGVPECLDWEQGYLDYLRDARSHIELCSWACRAWSAPYDGEHPSPASVPAPPPTSNPALPVFPEHFSFQQGGGGGARSPAAERRAAVVAAARSEWGSSERDSGEWDVTIGKNNCISLTPRSKKRSLQREELPRPLLLPPASTTPSSASVPPTAAPLPPSASVARPAVYNGTAAQGDVRGDGQDGGMEVKKVKRDSDSLLSSGDSGQNGAVGLARPRGSSASGRDRSLPDPQKQSLTSHTAPTPQPSAPTPQPSAPTPQPSASDACSTDSPTAPFPPSGLPELGLSNQGLESVESLIEELLEQAPDDTRPLGDSNGQGISIEAFTQELSELEDRVRERRGAGLEESPRDPLSALGRPDEEPPPTSPLDGDLSGAEARAESSAVGLFSPARPLGQAASQPYTGPFMGVLLAKLENMLQNSLYVNILLTGILSQLACYPQPLLRSFLLNTNMVFQPSVKSLIQVLGSVKNRIEAFAASHEDFPSMLRKAQRYLAARGKLDWADSPAGVPPLRRSDSLVKSRKPSLGDLILRHTNSPTRARHAAQLALAHVRDGGQSLHSALFRGGATGLEKQAEALRVKNAVYCAVIFSEFLKELAALALEHAVTVPFPRYQEAEE